MECPPPRCLRVSLSSLNSELKDIHRLCCLLFARIEFTSGYSDCSKKLLLTLTTTYHLES